VNPAPVPTLEELLAHPERVKGLPLQVLVALQSQISADQHGLAALQSALAAETTAQLIGRAHTQPGEHRMLTVDEVAKRLSVSKDYVYELVDRGVLPSIRVGRYVRIPAHALELWIIRQQALAPKEYAAYTRGRDWARAPADPKAARAHASPTGGAPRRHREYGRALGAKRDADPRTNRAANPADQQGG
jgi:excisionase family DNA binding protein